MPKIIRLTESDLERIVRRVMNEQKPSNSTMPKKPSPTPPTKKPTIIGKTVKIYSDKRQKKSFGDYIITNFKPIAGFAFGISLKPFGDAFFKLDTVSAKCDRNELSHYDTDAQKRIFYYNKQLTDFISKNFCKKGSGGINVPATTDFVATEPTPQSFA